MRLCSREGQSRRCRRIRYESEPHLDQAGESGARRYGIASGRRTRVHAWLSGPPTWPGVTSTGYDIQTRGPQIVKPADRAVSSNSTVPSLPMARWFRCGLAPVPEEQGPCPGFQECYKIREGAQCTDGAPSQNGGRTVQTRGDDGQCVVQRRAKRSEIPGAGHSDHWL